MFHKFKIFSLLVVIVGVFVLLSACASKKSIYTVSFDSQGGTVINDLDNVVSGSKIDLPVPEKEGYFFEHWQLNGKTFDENSEVSDNIKLKAVWEKISDVLDYVINDNQVYITSYHGHAKHLIIPNMIDQHIVSYIAMNAFKDSQIESIKIPNSITHIAKDAFLNASDLNRVQFYGDYMGTQEVTISALEYMQIIQTNSDQCVKSADPDDVNNDTKWVFSKGCPISKVEGKTAPITIDGKEYFSYNVVVDLTYYDKIQSPIIGEDAFKGTNLKTMELPSRCSFDFSLFAFINLSSLESITVNEANPNYTSVDGILYSKDKKELVFYPLGKKDHKYVIPVGVTTLGNYAINNSQILQTLVIPDSVTQISAYAIDKFKKLNLVLYVPDDKVNDYISKYDLSQYADRIKPMSDLPNN